MSQIITIRPSDWVKLDLNMLLSNGFDRMHLKQFETNGLSSQDFEMDLIARGFLPEGSSVADVKLINDTEVYVRLVG
jgi:hypothetical protein